MRLSLGRPAIRRAMGVALCAYALAGAFSFTGYARQSRSITEGVYSAGKARPPCIAGEEFRGLHRHQRKTE